MRHALLLALACLVLPAQTQDPAYDPLEKAYRSLRERKYLDAIEQFIRAAQAAPGRASIRKELGYAYLKIGETESAREVFEQALRLEPADAATGLELAFLCHETGREARALELFDQVRRSGGAEAKQKAEEAYARVDGELRRAIERWSAAVEQDPANRAARLELARNLEKRREPARAAEQYLAAWRLPPRREETLLDLARARHDAGDAEGAAGAWLLAARSPVTRLAERAREKLPRREPFANEYRRALELDPAHSALRRDLAFLLLATQRADEAVAEFEAIVRQDPKDMLAAAQLGFLYLERQQAERAVPLLEKVARGPDAELARRARETLATRKTSERREGAHPYKVLAEKSLALSYLDDARRYYQAAYEIDPEDLEVAFQLGVVHNILRDDREALRWFGRAMRSPDAPLAARARRGHSNLAPQFKRFQTTLWTYPVFSSRWHDAFQYAQLKTELKLKRWPVRPYLSLRLIADWKRREEGPLPYLLSENSLIAGVGARTGIWHGLMLWGEAGQSISYLRERPPGTPRAGPDYRGGLMWFRGLGTSLARDRPGSFAEFNADVVYLSRYSRNVIAYWQMRPGWRLPGGARWRSQLFWNVNLTADRRREYYANFAEIGPGYRFRLPQFSRPVDVTVSALRGVYLINAFNPRPPHYYDLRVALWYSLAR